jgi:hypothetical protein
VAADRQHRHDAVQLPRRLDAVDLRHLDVHHDRVRLQLLDERDGLAAVPRLADDLEPPVGAQQLLERRREIGVVLGQNDPATPRDHP